MRVSRIFASVAPLLSIATAIIVQPSSIQFDIPQEYADIQSTVESFIVQDGLAKRDSVATLEGIINSVANSGIIFDLLDEIASSDTQMDNLANAVISILGGNLSALTSRLGGLNISLNISTIWQTVQSSGIIPSTADGLLLNETNRDFLASRVGNILVTQTWISQLLIDLGHEAKLSFDNIAKLIKTVKSKANGTQVITNSDPNSKSVFIGKRSDYQGSAQAFINNLVGQVVGSNILSQTAGDFLVALNRTGVVAPLALKLLDEPSLATIITTVSPKIYNSGELSKIDLNGPYEKLKKESLLSDGLQWVLVQPTYSPPLGLLLKYLDKNGYYQQIQDSLFGPHGNSMSLKNGTL